MNETEQNTQRIMTELLAAHAQTKRMLAENEGLLHHAAELDKIVGEQRLRIGELYARIAELEAASYAFLEFVDYDPDPEDDAAGENMNALWVEAERMAREALEEK